jgi:hypothetical protein
MDADGNTITDLGAPVNPGDAARLSELAGFIDNPLTSDLDADGFTVKNLAAPVDPNDAARLADIPTVPPAFSPAYVYAQNATNTAIPAGSKIPFATVIAENPASAWDTTNHEYDCPTDGVYAVDVICQDSGGNNNLGIYVNGSLVQSGENSGPGTPSPVGIHGHVVCNAGDLISVRPVTDQLDPDTVVTRNNLAIVKVCDL